jgi:hypothetical protein
MSTYAWIVTKDHVVGDNDPTVTIFEEVNVIAPSDATDEQIADLIAGKGTAFRMYDDDGYINLSGRFLGDPNSEEAFGPLDDYGIGAYGCTYIKYRQSDGSWATL